MKTCIRLLLLTLLALSASAYGGLNQPIDVTVSDATHKVAFKGRTAEDGTFSTGNLPGGAYVVMFNSKSAAELKGKMFGIIVAGGKQKMGADAIAGERFAGAGVAVKVDVTEGKKLTAQVVNASSAARSSNVKITKGKRFVYVKEVGSNVGKWVEEGTPEAGNVSRMSRDGLTRWQDGMADVHQEGFPNMPLTGDKSGGH